MKGTKIYTAIIICTVFILISCKNSNENSGTVRSMYYWSTTMRMDSTKEKFIHDHDISRMYLRYFDVVDDGGEPVPNATLRFVTPVPQHIEIVPVVFIVNSCMTHPIDGLAGKIYKRIKQMSATNDITNVREIQIDCDWSMRTRQTYFEFLKELREMAHKDKISLSTTIRLHQLSQQAPPVERGVLMMYNTGDFTDIECRKPILDMNDVAPYLSALSDYGLPLVTAYPIFSWRILFRRNRYVGIMHSDDELPVLPGDSIVERQTGLDDLLKARDAVSRKRPDANDEIILFDMNNQNITRFKPEDYEKIYLR